MMLKRLSTTLRRLSFGLFALLSIVMLTFVTPAQAALNAPVKAKITISFDDGRASTYTKAAPILQKYGLSGTAYITTDCVGMTKTPNTCHAANDVSYMSWSQVKTLQNFYRWEIGSHSKSHPYMASTNSADGQPNMLTPQQVIAELRDSKAALAAQGINATAYASPYGDYNPYVLQEASKYYGSHRGFADQNNNVWPYNDMLLQNMQVQDRVSTADVKAKIDYAITNKTWLILTLHDVVDRPVRNQNKYQWGTSQFTEIAAYVKAKQDAGLISATNASGGLATGANNLLPGSDFTAGISNGWRTDQASIFSANGSGSGSFPESTHSVGIAANNNAFNAHLFSPRIAVSSSKMYLFKSYINVTSVHTDGEVGYYIDEFDAGGNWVSGQFKGRETSVFAESFNFTYVPTSAQVKTASLQIYSERNSGATGYLDSLRMFEVATDTAQTNLMPNGDFASGIANGWSTNNPSAITAQGGAVSINMASGTSHLFSPRITVDATKSYYLENYLSIVTQNNSEVGYYIDEFDASGNWVSGQYKLTAKGTGDHGFVYTPSSSSVKGASLQMIFTAGDGLQASVDNSRWYSL